MKTKCVLAVAGWLLLAGCVSEQRAARQDNLRETMKDSLVYLEISSYSYDQFRPWKNAEIGQKFGVGCAVGAYEVMTPAWNLTDATLVKARRFGNNNYIPATIKTIDYEVDLAILSLDPNAAGEPLKPLRFTERCPTGAKLDFYWLSEDDKLNSGHAYLDRAAVHGSTVSFGRFLNYIVKSPSSDTGNGQVYCDGQEPIGVACWSEESQEAGIIPAEIINRFLADTADGDYRGAPCVGFATDELLDPAMRAYLRMPAAVQDGVLVSDVFTVGTGSSQLKVNDVILAIDSRPIDARGRFSHRLYDAIMFDHLITTRKVGESIPMTIWRDGAEQQLAVEAKTFAASQMLIPFYEYGRRPKYIVTAGLVFQRLTRPYMTSWGKDWSGRISPHIFHYYRDKAFKPSAQRKDIVVLSYVLPAPINLAYKDLAQLVVEKVNGVEIRSMEDFAAAQKLTPDSPYDVVEFELDSPKIVIPRAQLSLADSMIAQAYGITALANTD